MIKSNGKIRILAVFNRCTETTVPFENFIHVNPAEFEKHILSLYQTTDELRAAAPQANLPGLHLHGLGAGHFPNLKPVRLATLLSRIKPQIIHTHHSVSGVMVSALGTLATRARIMATVHNDFRFFNRRQKAAFALTYLLADRVVFNSGNTKNSIAESFARYSVKADTEVIYNGVDVEKVAAGHNRPAQRRDSVNAFVVGTVARLVSFKDHKTLLRAFAGFTAQRSNSVLKIVGDGPLRGELESLARELQIRDKVILRGLLPRAEVYRELKSMDLFVVSSRWEGFCNAMVEAMLAGVPVIASNVGPLPEVLGRDTGEFFQVGDAEGLCEKMLKCHDNHEFYRLIARQGCEFARQRYSLAASVANYEKAYRSMVGN